MASSLFHCSCGDVSGSPTGTTTGAGVDTGGSDMVAEGAGVGDIDKVASPARISTESEAVAFWSGVRGVRGVRDVRDG